MYEIRYYTLKGRTPVVEFIKAQTPKIQAKILREIDLLQEFGLSLGTPHIKKIKGTKNLWELRIKHSTDNFRIFYFCFTGSQFVLLHAIRKTTGKIPMKEVDIALKRLHNFLKGCDNYEAR